MNADQAMLAWGRAHRAARAVMGECDQAADGRSRRNVPDELARRATDAVRAERKAHGRALFVAIEMARLADDPVVDDE